jgi:uncharacterized membrane protein YhfC
VDKKPSFAYNATLSSAELCSQEILMDPRLILSYLLAIAIEILFPLLLAIWLRRRFRITWSLLGYGALIFLVFQILTRLPVTWVGEYFLGERLASDRTLLVGWIVLAAFTAALFEEGGRYLGYRFLWKKQGEKSWDKALMYGAGHGGLESILVGVLAVVGLINVLYLSQVNPDTLPISPEQIEQVRQAKAAIADLGWWTPLLGAWERLMALAIQISLSVMVLQVFLRKRFFWWWLALGYHMLVDLLAGLLVLGYVSAVQIELILLPIALFSVGIILWLRPKDEEAIVNNR